MTQPIPPIPRVYVFYGDGTTVESHVIEVTDDYQPYEPPPCLHPASALMFTSTATVVHTPGHPSAPISSTRTVTCQLCATVLSTDTKTWAAPVYEPTERNQQ